MGRRGLSGRFWLFAVGPMHSALRYLRPVEFEQATESNRRDCTDGPDDQTARFLVHMSLQGKRSVPSPTRHRHRSQRDEHPQVPSTARELTDNSTVREVTFYPACFILTTEPHANAIEIAAMVFRG